ncbi:Ig-like domain-containing protein [Chitinophagaceae bacterium LB-8]|jgi:Big-like domain-containing protein|uniref:Ig-like domain-containing protein n=1 Tax=Paraflavisolibacter caeni TaxID=2982496 RepID=A0A9X2XVI3_9BACT|nr:Ig-like domain-containing protein [Paraflavisolibacter caeni]MCU7549565.1 Ig-like domain-containing protein [Paraflavisolibacter caeni]
MKQILLSLLILCIVSCSKNKDEEAPVITISSPTNNQSFAAGQTVNVSATVTDNVELHEVHLFVTNNATGHEVVHFEQHADAKTLNIDKSFTAQTGITYRIRVEADDHAGNGSEAQVLVSSQ